MSEVSVALFPFCNTCSAIKTEGFWVREGSLCKTTEKLSACGKCYITRYCNQDCQAKNWKKHKVSCVTSEIKLNPSKIDKMITGVVNESGSVILNLDAEKKLVSREKIQQETKDEKLQVVVKIDGKESGSFCYLLCTRGFDWENELKTAQNPFDIFELGKKMIEKRLYKDAFNMISEKIPDTFESLKDVFFSEAILLMHTRDGDTEKMNLCAPILKKNKQDVKFALTPLEFDTNSDLSVLGQIHVYFLTRDNQCCEAAKLLVDLGLFEKAFLFASERIQRETAKSFFFEYAREKMVKAGLSKTQINELTSKIVTGQ